MSGLRVTHKLLIDVFRQKNIKRVWPLSVCTVLHRVSLRHRCAHLFVPLLLFLTAESRVALGLWFIHSFFLGNLLPLKRPTPLLTPGLR